MSKFKITKEASGNGASFVFGRIAKVIQIKVDFAYRLNFNRFPVIPETTAPLL
jgi:hypothetical protein